jgi:hypothetical protein
MKPIQLDLGTDPVGKIVECSGPALHQTITNLDQGGWRVSMMTCKPKAIYELRCFRRPKGMPGHDLRPWTERYGAKEKPLTPMPKSG